MSPEDTKPTKHYTLVTVLVEQATNALSPADAEAMLRHKLQTIAVHNKDLTLTIVRRKGDNTSYEELP
jgi:hypothetical protein